MTRRTGQTADILCGRQSDFCCTSVILQHHHVRSIGGLRSAFSSREACNAANHDILSARCRHTPAQVHSHHAQPQAWTGRFCLNCTRSHGTLKDVVGRHSDASWHQMGTLPKLPWALSRARCSRPPSFAQRRSSQRCGPAVRSDVLVAASHITLGVSR